MQIKGLAGVYYDTAKPGEITIPFSFSTQLKIMQFMDSIPFRYSSMHLCLKPGKGNMALNNNVLEMMILSWPQYSTVRTRVHFGSDMELQYVLKSHGVPLESFPVDGNGSVRQEVLAGWHKEHMGPTAFKRATNYASRDEKQMTDLLSVTADPSSLPAPGPVTARPNDILMGRGRRYQNNPGNVLFRSFLLEYKDIYDAEPINKRRNVSNQLYQILKSQRAMLPASRDVHCNAYVDPKFETDTIDVLLGLDVEPREFSYQMQEKRW